MPSEYVEILTPVAWSSCAYCWGQRRVYVTSEAANGEGAILSPVVCPACLGVGETLTNPS